MGTKSRELERGCRIHEIDADTNDPKINGGCYKLEVYDWLKGIPRATDNFDIVEIRLKNTRKLYFRNTNGLNLRQGDIVAVEGSPGHDIGVVSLTGELVKNQLKKNKLSPEDEFKIVYRKAKQADIIKWKEAVEKEIPTMLRTREMIKELGLDMKLGDVEFQGDKTKAIFYYIAEERVDFRKLIKIMADEFRIRVEMKQIGARQEAGRLGGIGPCGRELCCTTWLSNFVSATTHSARQQELSPNPQKLAGLCSKLKCCINYELPVYLDARKHFPATGVQLKTKKGTAHHVKNDIYKGLMYFEMKLEDNFITTPIPVERVKDILSLNKKGEMVESLEEYKHTQIVSDNIDYTNNLNQESLSRFENKKTQKKKRKKKHKKRKPGKNETTNS